MSERAAPDFRRPTTNLAGPAGGAPCRSRHRPDPGLSETKSISVALWDHTQKNTLRIDLWAKDMPVEDMKRFHVECLGGIAQSILSSTKDEFMSNEVNALCDRLVKHLKG